MAFERVYTVWDYYDGPRTGIADYCGQPHHYRCEWNDAKNDYANTFVLTPVDQETFNLAMEQWAIWRDWENAFHRGEVAQSTHSGLAKTKTRYTELEATLTARISSEPAPSKRARAVFQTPDQANLPPGVIREEEAEWTVLESVGESFS
jgi:hypothetical protein